MHFPTARLATLACVLFATLPSISGLAQTPPPPGVPAIHDQWRFFCDAKPVEKARLAKLKDAATTASAGFDGATAHLNYACVLSQWELDVFEKRLQQFQQKPVQGQKPPVLDQRGSADQIKQAATLLVEAYKPARKSVDVLYLYGYVLALNNDPLAVNIFDELATKFPKSDRALSSSLPLGEYYFGRGVWDKALREYNTALKSKEEGVREYTQYKIAWTNFMMAVQTKNKPNQQKATSQFLAQLKAATASNSPVVKRLAPVIQANIMDILSDMGDVEYARRVLTESGQSGLMTKLTEKIAFGKIDAKDTAGAYRLFASLVKDNPNSPDNPRIMGYLVDIAGGQQNVAAVIKNLRFMVGAYVNTGSKWSTAQKPDVSIKAAKSTEDLIYNMATAMDQQGRQTKNETYLKGALELYDLFVKTFPQSAHHTEVQFYWGQLLYERKQFTEASARLTAMLKADPKSKFTKDASDLMVTAAQSAMDADKTNYNLPKPGMAPAPMAIPAIRKNFADALDQYNVLFPKNENAPAMQYAAASVYYDFGQYDIAAKRYYNYIKANPAGQFTREAALRILHYYKNHKKPDAFMKTRDLLAKIPQVRSAPELAVYFAPPATPTPTAVAKPAATTPAASDAGDSEEQ